MASAHAEPLLSQQSVLAPEGKPSPRSFFAGLGAKKKSVSFQDADELEEEERGWFAVRCQYCWPLFIPGVLQGKSTAVITPMLPLFITQDLNGSVAMVGFAASVYSLAQVWTSVPMGWVLDKVHHRRAAVMCLGAVFVSAILTGSCYSLTELILLRFLSGAAANAWNLSRKVWLAVEVSPGVRGRISSTLTGMSRLASFFAALISGYVAQNLQTRSVFYVQALLTGCALLTLFSYNLTHELPMEGQTKKKKDKGAKGSTWQVFQDSWRGLLTAGGFSFMLNGCRQMWMIVLPLQAHAVGLDKMGIGSVIAISRAMDAIMSIGITGSIVDTYGRRAAGVPGMLLIALAYHLTTVANDVAGLMLASVVYGVGNGFTGGLTNTLSVDVCPEENKATFMALWKMYTSVGSLSAPLVYGILADQLGSTGLATVLVSFLALAAAAWLALLVPEPKVAEIKEDAPSEKSFQSQRSQLLIDG
eukprot:TRINITY_DN28999_c0_g1_i2.p1 TRINITY_DN28999_c0_g1~~TRINITY_DN28999_c0_g1_i2.p1  ORF type:complete len:474 (+),score=93.15 TRINITY_DN28999_c0_g1_i2:54-1475(+)